MNLHLASHLNPFSSVLARSLRAILIVLIFSFAVQPARPAAAFDIPDIPTPLVVTTLTLANDAQDGQCDLWEALKTAFDLEYSDGSTTSYHECSAAGAVVAGSTVIAFSPSIWFGTIQLPAPDPYPEFPFINGNVLLLGPVTIDGGGKDADLHIFRLTSDSKLTLIGLTLTNAYTSGSGAAILSMNYGEITLIGVSILGNTAESDGGAIDTNGDLSITASAFSGNLALGVMPDGVTDASGVGYGGAINAYGTSKLSLTATAFNGNIADKGGGAIFFSGSTMEVGKSTFNGNIVNDLIATSVPDALRGGGAIYLDSDTLLKMDGAAFDGNLSLVAPGGALSTAMNSNTDIVATSFNANIAGTPLSSQPGGAIYTTEALTLTRSALLFNVATGNGGALFNDRGAYTKMFNVTLAGNDASSGSGGAIWNGSTQNNNIVSTVLLRNVTLSDNHASTAGAIYNQPTDGHTVMLGNTIVNQGSSFTSNCNTALTSEGHNLDSGSSCDLAAAGDQSATDPQLDSLGFNGGPIFSLLSMKLKPGSPALDGGDGLLCQAAGVDNKDQRDEKRPQDGDGDGSAACDIGAVENDGLKAGYASTPVQPGPIVVGSATVGGSVQSSFVIYETSNFTLTISAAELSGANPGEFAVNTPLPLAIPDGGTADLQLTCTPQEGQRAAQLTLTTNDSENPSVVYDLQCSGTPAPVAGFASAPIAPGPLDFGAYLVNTTDSRIVHLFETGSADLTISSQYDLIGANPSDFALVTALPLVIADNSSGLDLTVECTPQDYGVRSATLVLHTNDPLNPSVEFNLLCQGVTPPPQVLERPGQSLPAGDAPYGAAISPDGRYMYVASLNDDAVQVYQRDLVTGDLTLIQTFTDGAGDLDGVWMLTPSADGNQIYAAASVADTIVTLKRDPDTGLLTKGGRVSDGQGYACFPLPCKYKVDGLDGVYDMVISPDGKFLYASSLYDNGIAVFGRDANGSLSALFYGPRFIQFYTDPVALNQAYGLAISPDGKYLYATGYQSGDVVVFSRDAENGKISPLAVYSAADIPSLAGVFRLAVSPDGLFLYAGSWNSSAITAFRRNPLDGTLTYLAEYRDSTPGLNSLAQVTAVAVSPDGRYLFATSFTDRALNVFARDPITGLLTLSQVIVRHFFTHLPALDGARDVEISSDGRFVVTTGYNDDKMSAFRMANPVPMLESLSPGSAQVGSQGFTLSLFGQHFIPGSQVEWNGVARETTLVSEIELQITLQAADLAASGTAIVTVNNPAPEGGPGNPLEFVIYPPADNPPPVVESLSPQGAPAASPDLPLTIIGSGFVQDSVAQWNGEDRPTTYLSASELQIAVAASELAQPGAASVRVISPTPGGGTSKAVLFEIAAPGVIPPPSIEAVTPGWMYARGPAAHSVHLTVTGANFTEDSLVLWNGAALATEFVSGAELRATLTGAQLALPAEAKVSVSTPAPGGGLSTSLPFTLKQPYDIFIPLITD